MLSQPQNNYLRKVDPAFAPEHVPLKSKVTIETDILHDMISLHEEEKISHFEFIVIKPIGMGSAVGNSMTDSSAGTINKGHVINAAILYVLESGLMKVVSTTGAILFEKSIYHDVGEGDKVVQIVSSSNTDDMHVYILT